MRKVIWGGCIVLLVASMAMAQGAARRITFRLDGAPTMIDLTDAEVASIERLTSDYNASQGPPTTLTGEEWLEVVVRSAIGDWSGQTADEDAVVACVNYAAASQATRDDIDADLGGVSPCP